MKKNNIWQQNRRIYFISQFCHSLIFTVPVVIAVMQAKISASQISFLFAWRYFIQIIAELPTGALADMIGKKKAIQFGFLFFIIYIFAFMGSDTFLKFLFIFSLAGISEAFLSGSVQAMIYDSLKQDGQEKIYQKTIAKENYLYQIGLMLSSFFGGYLDVINHQLPFILYGLCLSVGFLSTCFYQEPKVDSEKFSLSTYRRQIILGFKEAFKDKFIQKLSFFYILVESISWSLMLYFSKVMLIDLGFDATERGIIQAIQRLVNLLILQRILSSVKFNQKLAILFFPLILILSLLPAKFFNGYLALPFITLGMLASTAKWTLLGEILNQRFVSRYRATAISSLSMISGILYVLITLISGPIIENYGGVKTIYVILGIISFMFVLPLALVLTRELKQNNFHQSN